MKMRIKRFIGWFLLRVLGISPTISHGIHGGITAGYGKLDEFGFFQYPVVLKVKNKGD